MQLVLEQPEIFPARADSRCLVAQCGFAANGHLRVENNSVSGVSTFGEGCGAGSRPAIERFCNTGRSGTCPTNHKCSGTGTPVPFIEKSSRRAKNQYLVAQASCPCEAEFLPVSFVLRLLPV